MGDTRFVLQTVPLIQKAVEEGDLAKAQALALALEGDLGKQNALDLLQRIKDSVSSNG